MVRSQVVEDGKRLVIYRDGRFYRLRGPGRIMHWDPRDKVQDELDVRNKLHAVSVDGLFPKDLPLTVVVSLWARFDPEAVAKGNSKRLRELVLIAASDRIEQMRNDLRAAMIQCTGTINRAHGVPDDAAPILQVAPVFSDHAWHQELMQAVGIEVAPRLLHLGMILDPDRRLQVTRLEASAEDRESFARDRRANALRQRFPGLTDSMLAQITAALEGKSPLNIHELIIEGETGAAIETSLPVGAGQVTRIGLTPPTVAPAADQPVAPAATPPPEREQLTEHDLKVLKPIPRSDESRRAA